ncbi:MAG TPA: adenylate/guanylate cyclase domain-containing protein [Spirochaetia bacterium]|nr:adenylate/guanylate cyclase domain-containing protein [Spirochaetia bacterium]
MEQKEYRLAAVVFTDIVGFSRMMEQDETATLELVKQHNALIGKLTEQFGGSVIKTIGDAFLLAFPNTVNAVKCSVAIQNEIKNVHTPGSNLGITLRIGAHLGDIYFFENDALGEGINIASRLQSVAKPGRICISQDVFNLVSNKIELRISQLGEVKLKNISRVIQAYEIMVDPADTDSDSASRAATDPGHESQVDTRAGRAAFDPNSLKADVLQETKRIGRRLTLSEARKRFDIRGGDGERVLEDLANRGLVVREQSAQPPNTGTAGVGRPHGGWELWAQQITREITERVEEQTRDIDWGGHVHGPEARRAARHAARHMARAAARSSRYSGSRYHLPGDDLDVASDEWDRALSSGSDDATLVSQYRAHLQKVADSAQNSFRGHMGAFLGVNIGLAAIWAFTGAAFPWFLIPAGGWAIGLVTHRAVLMRRRREAMEIESIENPSREQILILRKLNRTRDSWSSHLVSNLAVSGFLVMLNVITSPSFPWSVFPIGGMMIGLLSHFPVYSGKVRALRAKLVEAGARFGARRKAEPAAVPRPAATGSISEQAAELRGAIIGQLKSFRKGESPVGEEFVPLLDNYVNQIRELDGKDRELEQIINSIPMGELEKDLARLIERRNSATDARVAEEYGNSIAQIQKQKQSFGELKNEKEMLHLRMNSAFNSLKQVQIDLARMKSISASAGSEVTSLSLLRRSSEELSQYLDDLHEGYDQLE